MFIFLIISIRVLITCPVNKKDKVLYLTITVVALHILSCCDR